MRMITVKQYKKIIAAVAAAAILAPERVQL